MKSDLHAFLGLDLGGTGAKAAVFDRAGALLAMARRSITPSHPQAGHVETPIAAIETAAREAVREVVRNASLPIRAFTVVTQGQTFVTLDENDCALHPAIVWYDSRAAEQARRLTEKMVALVGAGQKTTGFAAIASAPKICWLRENHPDIMKRARRFLLLPDYVAYRLTGQAITEPKAAGSTGLCVKGGMSYAPEALQAAEIREDQLSGIVPAGRVIGRLLAERAREWGLDADTIMVAGTNDQYAGALGAGNCRPGILSETSGTCLAMVTLTERLPPAMPRGMFGGSFPVDPLSYVMLYAKTAGVVLDWFREQCACGKSFDDLNTEALAVPIGCRGLSMVPHFDGMNSPHPDPSMRGAFHYLTLQHARADMFRSILEALSFSLRENLELLIRSGFAPEVIRCIGGGAKNEFWLQMKADVTGRIVEQPLVTEAAVLGAAMLAAWGAGAFPSLADPVSAWYQARRVFYPDHARHQQYEEPYLRYLRLTAASAR